MTDAAACGALYLHIPFCGSKCPYCDFYSLPPTNGAPERYAAALERAVRDCPLSLGALDTVYFGGGTPPLLGGERLARVLEAARRRWGIAPDAEVTLECNPHSALGTLFLQLARAGVNRVSLGMQSADDRQLEALGRRHTAQQTLLAAQAAQKAGIGRISLDLMLATPGQTKEDIERAVQLCDRAGAEHVSAYLLKIEEGTPFARQRMWEQCPDEDGQAELYLYAVGTLARYGYEQYEISNFAREGRVSRHNLKYWDGAQYLGIGPSAHSFIGGQRFYFPRDLGAFLRAPNAWALIEEDGPGGGAQEYLMLRLRLSEGVVWEELARRCPEYDPAPLRARALPMQRAGLLCCDTRGLRLTPEGFLLSNSVIGELLL